MGLLPTSGLGNSKLMHESRKTVGRMQLDQYVARIAEVYRANDRNRSIWDVWCHALHHAAGTAERLRKAAPASKVFEEIADFSLWLFTAIQKLEGKVGEPKGPNETVLESVIRIESGCFRSSLAKVPEYLPQVLRA